MTTLRFHTTQAKLDDNSLANNGTEKRSESRGNRMHHSIFTEEVNQHNTFPLKLLQFTVSQGEEQQFIFCLQKNRGIPQLEQQRISIT